MNSEGLVPAAFRDRLYATYVSGHQGVLDASRRYPTFKRDVLARLPARKSVRIVDVGCGQGDLMKLIRQSGWTEVSGFDASAEQVATARRLGIPNVTQARLSDYAAAHEAQYDVVLALDVVEHFDRSDVLEVFDALQHMLMPGGVLILQTPNGASPFAGRLFWSDVTHGMQYTDRSLAQICQAVGFATVQCFPQRPAPHGVVSSVRAVLWRVVELGLWLATAAETGRIRGVIVTQNLVAVARKGLR